MNKSLQANYFIWGCSQLVVQGWEGVKMPLKLAGRAAASAGTPPGQEYNTLGVAQAERAVWREVAGKGRGHNPRWPPSQAHHSGRII